MNPDQTNDPLPASVEYLCRRCLRHFRQLTQHTDADCANGLRNDADNARAEARHWKQKAIATVASSIASVVLLVFLVTRSLV